MAILLLICFATSVLWNLGHNRHKVQGMTNQYDSHFNTFLVHDEIWNTGRRANEKLLSCLLVLWMCSSSGTVFHE